MTSVQEIVTCLFPAAALTSTGVGRKPLSAIASFPSENVRPSASAVTGTAVTAASEPFTGALSAVISNLYSAPFSRLLNSAVRPSVFFVSTGVPFLMQFII